MTDHAGFRCPERLPASAGEEDRVLGRFPCPPRVPTPRFSSPNSPLPPEELEQLKACLEEVNDLLRTLGNPPDPKNKETLRLHLRRLRGQRVLVEMACGGGGTYAHGGGQDEGEGQENGGQESEKTGQGRSYAGILRDAGKDYLELDWGKREKRGDREEQRRVLLPYGRVCMVTVQDPDESFEPPHHPELIDIDPDLRRDLVLSFGRVVASNPELISIFFGLPLHLRLRQEAGVRITVRLEGDTVTGQLSEVDEESIKVRTAPGAEHRIILAEVCAILI
ncbi:MAG: hypothetical protein IMX00_09495 [Limnochordales bacterium]|nr:hypothetical protein [Limnochordales bacterium]